MCKNYVTQVANAGQVGSHPGVYGVLDHWNCDRQTDGFKLESATKLLFGRKSKSVSASVSRNTSSIIKISISPN